MVWAAYGLFGSYIIANLVTLIFLTDRYEFGPEVGGPYSIFSSKGFFIAYNVWGIILAGVAIYSLWKKQQKLLLISLIVLMALMFYPYYSSQPTL